MKRSTKMIAGGVIVVAAAATGAGISIASAGDSEAPITGVDLDEATRVALDHTGEGRVTETEVGDEESFYEVEVTLDDGRQVDVQLDEGFNVVGDEMDNETEQSPDDD